MKKKKPPPLYHVQNRHPGIPQYPVGYTHADMSIKRNQCSSFKKVRKKTHLWKIRNKLAVSKRLVVAHVGVKGCCVHQESLRQTQNKVISFLQSNQETCLYFPTQNNLR